MAYRTRTRLAAATLAAAIGIVLPAGPAAAQEKPGTGAVPPPVDMSVGPVSDTKGPPSNIDYKHSVGCTASLNQGVVLPNRPWGQQQLRVEDSHAFATGKNQMVAVIDTGVRRHPYFFGRVVEGADYVNKQSNALEDCDGHGTEVAGIIAARSPNPKEIGFTGMAPDAKILAIRQSSQNYKGKSADDPNGGDKPAGDLNTLAQAVVGAANTPGVTVINMSVDSCRPASDGMRQGEKELQRALRYAVSEKNVVVVASAGNITPPYCADPTNGPDPKKPKSIITPPWFAEDVLSVAAVNSKGNLAPFSMQGPWVSVAAPGTEIISLDPAGTTLANQTIENSNKIPIQGTSFAAPYVAGLAAQIRDRFPKLNARQVMNRIKQTAQHPAAPGGRDNLVGYGMINPMAALTVMIPGESGIAPDKVVSLPPNMPPIRPKNWTPMTIALIGAGGGIVLLLITLFVMHAVRRNRPVD
jgi:membrane-anchored mycosin MYCP